MTRAKVGGWTVRVWTDTQGKPLCGPNLDVLNACKYLESMEFTEASLIAQNICELPHINAVEVTDHIGDGLLIYPEWP